MNNEEKGESRWLNTTSDLTTNQKTKYN